MTIIVTRDVEALDWQMVADLFGRAPLGVRDPTALKQAFRNSYATSIAWRDDVVVGLGRAISDGISQAAVYDVVVEPEIQGEGIGSALMRDLHEQLRGVENVILFAVPGKERFYERFGYRTMKTAMGILAASLSDPSEGYLED